MTKIRSFEPAVRSASLYVFSGLPGAGKTTIAEELARHLGATFLRIDTVEQGLRDLCNFDVQGEGYRLSYRIAADNLRLGLSVVADSCNPWALTRNEWRDVAMQADARCVDIEVTCSSIQEHRRRVETRCPTVPGLELPTWQQVVDRDYEPWTRHRLVVDTAGRSIEACVSELLASISSPSLGEPFS